MAQALVAELARLLVLVQAAVLERPQGREPAQQQELSAVPESPQSQEPAAVLEQARELRVSRQLKL